MSPRPSVRPPSWLLAAALVVLVSPSAARAQDAPQPGPQPAGHIEDRARIEDLVASLNNPIVWRAPAVLRERIARLVSSRHPLAVERVRELIRDTGGRTVIVQEAIHAVLVDRAALELVPDVVERLRVEQDSALGLSFDESLLRYADVTLVRTLAELSRDEERSEGYRETALRTLARTGHAAALPALLELWDDPSPKLRLAASRGFVHIVPGVDSRDAAAALLDEMRERDLPLSEVLRRRLRVAEAARPEPVPDDDSYEIEYRELARAALRNLPLPDVLRLYLGSPLPDLRAAAADRIAEFPFDAEADPAGARVAAARALLLCLRREDVDEVEAAVLTTLLPLAGAVAENVGDPDMAALAARVRIDGRASRTVRIAAIDFLTALGDPRPIPLLEEQFDLLGDTDPDLRIELLDALAASNGDLTGWLLERVLDEPHVMVMRQMVVKLGKDPDPAAIDVFATLLTRTTPTGERAFGDTARSYAAKALGRLTLRGNEAARDVLITRALDDPAVAVRDTAASELATPRSGDREPALRALAALAGRTTEVPKVRQVAVRGVLDLDPVGALARLGDAIDDPIVWDVYRMRRTEELRGGHSDVDDVLAEADALWLGARRERSLELLRAVVDAGTGLWEGRTGRGRVREVLVERLLDAGQPADACTFAEALVADPPRTGDPTYRWRLLLARSLRACGQGDRLQRAATELRALTADTALPTSLRPQASLELGHALLQLGDPTAALVRLEAVGDAGNALDAAQKERLADLRARARTESDAEKARVLVLVAGGADASARQELVAMGPRAARHVERALVGVTDATAARPLLAAAAVLTGEAFVLPPDATPEGVAGVVKRARDALERRVAAGPDRGSR